MLKTGRRLALLGMLAMAITGCGGDDDGGGTAPTNITGTYTLRTVNNQNPPVTVFELPGFKVEVLGATLTLAADMTWDQVISVRETEDGVADEYDDPYSGTYTRTGNTLRLVDEFDDVFTATVQSDGAIVFQDIGGSSFNARFTK